MHFGYSDGVLPHSDLFIHINCEVSLAALDKALLGFLEVISRAELVSLVD